MLRWILTFAVLAILAGAVGLSGAAASFAWIAQLLAVVFLALFVVSIVMNGARSVSNGGTP